VGRVCSSIYLSFQRSRIRYQEKQPNGREVEELDIIFYFFCEEDKKTKGSKSHTNNIT
jgi:hypothetical protein